MKNKNKKKENKIPLLQQLLSGALKAVRILKSKDPFKGYIEGYGIAKGHVSTPQNICECVTVA